MQRSLHSVQQLFPAEVDVTIPEAGRAKTTAQVENGILAISNPFTRSRATARECVGASFYATSTELELDNAAIPNAISIVQDENQFAGAERLG
jgi:hypothetical protein